MATIMRFEEIEAWQKARELNRMIYDCSNGGAFGKDFGLRDQIRRVAVSVMSNIAEGFGRGGNKEFIQFLSTARGSTAEIQAQLYVALDAGYITRDSFDRIQNKALDTSNLISGFIRYLANSQHKGSKYANRPLNHEL